MDYKTVGLKAGIEIHQQLDSRTKLFCRCPTSLREFEEHTDEYFRFLRATESEMGEIDEAAREEMKNERRFCYYTHDTTCLVEDDEEPPQPLNREALTISLTIAKMLGMSPVDQIHTMRKLVIDGSNTSGFQRTALVALDGAIPVDVLPGGGGIETICLEEEAAQRVDDHTFSLDRLGIPLVEITTSPCMKTPEEVQEVAGYLGMVLRSTGKVKRGLGTIRQDINISISGGARVEIKGVQELDLIAEVVRREVRRQENLLSIRDELIRRGAGVREEPVDVTHVFSATSSGILKKADRILALVLPFFGGLVGREIQPGRRLGSELSDYAKKCGLGGIFHTDELPGYGVTPEEVSELRTATGASDRDCVIIVAGPEKKVHCAVLQVIKRARLAFEGIPEETRRMLEGGSTSYMRPLPGAARMYPETDVEPVYSRGIWGAIQVPELITRRIGRLKDLGLDPGVAEHIGYSELYPLFEQALYQGIPPALAARTLTSTVKELRREGVAVDHISDDELIGALAAVGDGRAAKEAVPEILRLIAGGTPLADALEQCAGRVSVQDLGDIVRAVVRERQQFVIERGMASLGPLMGVVMAEVRGSVDGKVVSDCLKDEIRRILQET
jgi:glutamyl-tRNA(Gln) amidotransferase subunit E